MVVCGGGHSKKWNGTRSERRGPFQELEWYTVWDAGAIPRIGMVHGLGRGAILTIQMVHDLGSGCHSKNRNGTGSGRRGAYQELEWFTVWEALAVPRIGMAHGLRGGAHSVCI